MEVCGKIVEVQPPVTGTSASGKEWKKQTFILRIYDEIQSAYPRHIAFTHWGDRYVHNVMLDAEVTVYFDLESREFNGRWYTDAKSYRVDPGVKVDGYATPQNSVAAPAPQPQQQQVLDVNPIAPNQEPLDISSDDNGDFDLPF